MEDRKLTAVKREQIIAIPVNIVLVILAVIGAVMSVESHGSVPSSLLFYTQDSNLFLGVAALIKAVYAIRAVASGSQADVSDSHSVATGRYAIPAWVHKLKYFAVCCVAVTLFVVVFILAPMASSLGGLRWIMLTGCMLYQHFLSPVIAIITFLLFEKTPALSFRFTLFALVPTLLYALALYPLNIIGVVNGPYPFLQVREMSIGMSVMWFFVLLCLAYLLAWLIWLLNRKIKIKLG